MSWLNKETLEKIQSLSALAFSATFDIVILALFGSGIYYMVHQAEFINTYPEYLIVGMSMFAVGIIMSSFKIIWEIFRKKQKQKQKGDEKNNEIR